MAAAEWLSLADAAAAIEVGLGSPRASMVMLTEWLRDGLLTARADRLIEHQLKGSSPSGGDFEAAIAAGPLPVWDWPTEMVIDEHYFMSAFNWSPIPANIEACDYWRTGRIICSDGDGTRARREYVGVKVERRKLLEAAAMYNVPCITSVSMAIDQVRRKATQVDLDAFGLAAVREKFGAGTASKALDLLWNQEIARPKRDDARNAIGEAKKKMGLSSGPGRPSKASG